MKQTESINDRLLNIASRVRLLGSSLPESRIVEKILVTMPEKFEATITSLESTKDMSKITLAELLNALQAREQRRAMRQEGEIEGALPAKHHEADKNKKKKKKSQEGNSVLPTSSSNKSRNGNFKGKYPPCHHCGKKGHPPFKCWRRPDAKCSKCNQLGHEAVICRNKNQVQEADAQVADQEEEDQLFVATCFSSRESNVSWLIDSGCTNHMTHDRSLFKELKPTAITKVRIGNGNHIPVKGKGTIVISTNSGTKSISDVLFVPDIDQNLLSVGQLIEKGFKVFFEDKLCLIQDANGKEIVKAKMRCKSFSFEPTKEEQAAYSMEENVTETWHKRLGHCHLSRMLLMKKKELSNGLPVFADHLSNCHACQFGKQNRKPFPKSTWRASHKLQLIHTDVAGPQRTQSLAGSRYYVIFIDDFSRMCWIFFMKHKSEVAGTFWKFKKMVEKQSGSNIQCIRSNNGREYTSDQFNKFCEESGIEPLPPSECFRSYKGIADLDFGRHSPPAPSVHLQTQIQARKKTLQSMRCSLCSSIFPELLQTHVTPYARASSREEQ